MSVFRRGEFLAMGGTSLVLSAMACMVVVLGCPPAGAVSSSPLVKDLPMNPGPGWVATPRALAPAQLLAKSLAAARSQLSVECTLTRNIQQRDNHNNDDDHHERGKIGGRSTDHEQGETRMGDMGYFAHRGARG